MSEETKQPTLKIRDGMSWVTDNKAETTIQSGTMEVIAEDGRTLLSIRLEPDGMFDISAGTVCKHEGVMLEDRIAIIPVASNRIKILRPVYEP